MSKEIRKKEDEYKKDLENGEEKRRALEEKFRKDTESIEAKMKDKEESYRKSLESHAQKVDELKERTEKAESYAEEASKQLAQNDQILASEKQKVANLRSAISQFVNPNL